MPVFNFPPSFNESHATVFNYAIQSIIVDILRSNIDKLIDIDGIKILEFTKKEYIVYTSEVDDDVVQKFYQKTSEYFCLSRLIACSRQAGGVHAQLGGGNPVELATVLAKHSGLSVDYIMDTYRAKILKLADDIKDDDGELVAQLIPKLYKLAVDGHRVKSDDEEYSRVKHYCDDDWAIYIYNDTFMISCSASANMYSVEFTPTGFIVYGHSNSYGKDIELEKNSYFDWDNASYEPYFLKHLSPNMIIMEVVDGEVKVQNTLLDMLRIIVEHIAEEENIVD